MTDPFSTPAPEARSPAEPAVPGSADAPALEIPRPRRRKPPTNGTAWATRAEPPPTGEPGGPEPAAAGRANGERLDDLGRMLRQDLLFDPLKLAVRPQPDAPGPSATPAEARPAAPSLPQDFVTDSEHPVLPVPFAVQMGEAKLSGVGLSVAAAYVSTAGHPDVWRPNHREAVRLLFDFAGFSLALPAEVTVSGSRRPGEMTLQFMDPLGPHLPQLRHIINSYIAGDLVSLGGLLSYSGPTKPKAAKAAEPDSLRLRIRSLAMAALSLALIATAGLFLLSRATQSYEMRPVFIERQGHDMRATTAGQVSYLNPQAKAGEVVFSINSNTGDALNFQLPCDCEVAVTEGIFEGATVLPIDLILTFFDSNPGIRVQAQISIEGLARVMDGDRAHLDMDDGRSIPVQVEVTSATDAAAQRGDLFVPVALTPADGALGQGDIGKVARLRLSTPWLPGLPFSSGEDS